MTIPQLTAALESVGATLEQAEDLAEIMYLCSWATVVYKRGPLNDSDYAALQTWLHDWIAENRRQAALVRSIRQQHIDAGYFGIPPEAPVRLNGRAVW